MQKYWNTVQDEKGNPREGASVAVQQSSSNSTIYANRLGSVQKTNPLTTDTRGYFEFYAAGGEYDLVVSGTGFDTYTITDAVLIEFVVNVKDFGAKGDGVTNDTAAIQAAIDAVRGASTETTPLIETRFVLLPKGIYLISVPVNLYSGIVLTGDGQGSLIKASGTFAGTALVLLKGQGANTYNQFSGCEHLGFQCSGSVWAIKANATTSTDGWLRDLWFNCGFAIDLGTYTQGYVIDGLFSNGSLDQLLHLKGNQNFIRNIDKEGSTGTSTDPYILLENHATNSNGNLLEAILLEGTTSANKSLIKLLNCTNTTLDSVWLEPSSTDGYGIRIQGCVNTRILKIPSGIGSTTKIKVDTSQNTRIDALDVDGSDIVSPVTANVEIDTTSDVHIGELRNRRCQDVFPLASLGRNLTITKVYSELIYTDAVTGYTPVQRVEWLCGQNLAVNGSFEVGRYGWAFDLNPTTTEEYITSEVGNGLMGHFIWAVSATHNMTQSVTVPANMPVTVTALVKIAAGAAGTINPVTSGLGITNVTGYHRANVSTGWQIISRTVIPTSAGSLLVGLQFPNATEVYVDEFSVSIGTLGVPNLGKYGTIEIGGKTFAVGTTAPTTGTWIAGARVYNSAPAIGSANFWKCTVAGSPGTWVADQSNGTFTCANNALTTVNNTDVTATSRIFITPTNAAAGTLQAGANALYVSAKTAATSFAVTTAAGGAAAGTETFDYTVQN